MIKLLQMLNYEMPTVRQYKHNSLEIVQNGFNFQLLINGNQWHNYDTLFHSEVFQFFPHYYLAKGHCICTGMGFLIREKWILNNPAVKKVTVLENCKDLIEYHKQHNRDVLDKIDCIECDANEYVGRCDTLLLDHYEQESEKSIIDSIKNIHKNIKCNTLWAWPLERMIDENFDLSNPLRSYEIFKNKNSMELLPDLNEQEILMFLTAFFMTDSVRRKIMVNSVPPGISYD